MLLPVKILLTLLHILCLPVHLITFLLLFIYKKCIILISKINQDFVESIPGSSCIFFPDTLWTYPHSSIITAVTLEGKPNLEKIVAQLQDLYDMTDEDGRRCYRELAYHPVSYYGHAFWKECPDFDIATRVQILKSSSSSLQEEEPVASMAENLLREPYQPGEPLWDVYLSYQPHSGDNQKSQKTIMFIRFHHLLADGMSFVKLFYVIFGCNKLPDSFTKAGTSMRRWDRLSTSIVAKIVTFFNLLTVGFIEYLDQVLIHQDKNLMNFDQDGKRRLSGRWICSMGKTLEVNELKKASKSLNCSIMHVLLAALSKGLEKYFAKYHGEAPVPRWVHLIFPVPIPGHPDLRLVNHWTVARVKSRLSIMDTTEAINYLTEETKQAVVGPLPLISAVMFKKVSGLLPISAIGEMVKAKCTSTVLISNIVGPQIAGTFGDCKASDMFFWMPISQESMALSMGVMSFNGKMHLNLTGDIGCIPDRSRLDDLSMMIHDEIATMCETITERF